MRLTIERASLLKVLAHVQSVVERRNTILILSNLLLTAREDGLRIAATDLDMEITEVAPAEVARVGSACAPAHTLYEFVRRLPESARVHLELDDREPQLLVRAGPARLQLPVLPPADFPIMPEDGMATRFSVHPSELSKLLSKTRFAISTEETRYYLNGIYLHTIAQGDQDVLRAVATDGHRLALAQGPAPEGSRGMPGVIVPRKAVNELARLLDDAADPVEIAVSEQKIRFGIGDAILTSKLIDGTFPQYERVIPRENPRHMRILNRGFSAAVDRVATVSAERSRSVQMQLENGKLTLTVSNPDAGFATEELEAEYNGAAIKIGFNAKYLTDVAGQIGGDSAQFEFADSGSPTLVRDPTDENCLYVLMPLRV